MSETRTGTVFDIGYQPYTGARQGQPRARRAVFKDGIRTALGIGRGPKAKTMPWGFIAILNGIALIMALIAGAVTRLAGPSANPPDLPSHGDFYGIASIIMYLFAAVVAPELLCRDRREGVINLYLVRPLTGTDYIVSRWLAFFVVLFGAACLPQVILLAGLTLDDPAPFRYLADHWLDLPRFVLAGAVLAAYLTTLALLVASFTTRRAYASVFLVGLFAITTPFTTGLASEIGGLTGQWISMFNLTNIPVHVNDVIFAEIGELTEEAPARLFADWIKVAWFALWTAAPALWLWTRYRRMVP